MPITSADLNNSATLSSLRASASFSSVSTSMHLLSISFMSSRLMDEKAACISSTDLLTRSASCFMTGVDSLTS